MLRSKLPLAVLVLTLATSRVAQAQITFDDLSLGSFAPVPLGYMGFNWFYGDGAFGSGTNLQYSTDISCFTTRNCAYNANANTPIRIESLNSLSSSTFTFAGYLASGYPGYGSAAQTVRAQGFVGTSSTAVFTTTLGLNADNTFKKFDLTGLGAVNKILLTPQQSAVIGASGYVRLDNVSLGAPTPGTTVAPEPSTILLLACGLGALAVAGRRRALGR